MTSFWDRCRLLASKVLRRGARLTEPKPRTSFSHQSRTEVQQRSPHLHLEWETTQLRQALAEQGIDLVAQPSGSNRLSVFGVRAPDLERAIAVISTLEGEWSIAIPQYLSDSPIPAKNGVKYLRAALAAGSLRVWCHHPLLATSSKNPHGVRLDVWSHVPSDATGDSVWEHRTPHGSVYRLADSDWSENVLASASDSPHLFAGPEPIDVVYTWVDDTDPDWRSAFEATISQVDRAQMHPSAYEAARFHEGDYLRYSLRSLEMYAPWVRHVYIVTTGQRPTWLNEESSRVTVVSHEDLFAEGSALPTFNSHAIEANLHRIEGLSERFLYVNDDVFFGDVVFPEDFFHGSGIAKFFPSVNAIAPGRPSRLDLPVDAAAKQTRDLVMRQWGREPTHKLKHTPHALRRDVLEELDVIFAEELERTRANPLRHPSDISLPSSLAHAAGYVMGKAVPGDITYRYVDVSSARARRRLSDLGATRPPAVMCLNEVSHKGHDAAKANKEVREFLERYYPYPSAFERIELQ